MKYENIDCHKDRIELEKHIRIYYPNLYRQLITHSDLLNLIKEIIFEYSGVSIPLSLYKALENYFSKFNKLE